MRRFLQMLRHGVLHLQLLRAITWMLSYKGRAELWLMYRKDLRLPIPAHGAKASIDIGVANDEDMDEIAALYHHARPTHVPRRARWFRSRLTDGSYCFVARIDGAIIAYNWIRVKSAIGAHGERMQLKDDEIYTTDAYTARAWRGYGIHTALNYAMLQFAQDSGYRIAYTLLRASNLRSWITMPRVGWKLTGTMLYFRPDRRPDAPIWYTAGAVYPMPVKRFRHLRKKVIIENQEELTDTPIDNTREQNFDTEFDKWVSGYISFDMCQKIRDWPWGKTYRISNSTRVTYLKVLSRHAASAPIKVAKLASVFPKILPVVIACDEHRGWLLTLEHQGSKLAFDSPEANLIELIETYAGMQSQAAADKSLLTSLPRVEISDPLPALLAFLQADTGESATGGRVGADYFIGPTLAKNYHRIFTRRRDLLAHHLAAASQLADTLNHGRLRPANCAMTSAGQCVLYSWQDATCGPAGLSLHGIFGGCSKPFRILSEELGDELKNSCHGRMLDHYIKCLVRHGYADERTLRLSLPAAITLGVMQYLSRFAKYRTCDASVHEILKTNLRKRLRDLLDLCDQLSLMSLQTTLDFSRDYQQHRHTKRAQSLLEQYLSNQPNDTTALVCFGEILTKQGQWHDAQKSYRRALESSPENIEALIGLGSLLMRELKFNDAATCFNRAREFDPHCPIARDNSLRADRLQRSWSIIRSLNDGSSRDRSHSQQANSESQCRAGRSA